MRFVGFRIGCFFKSEKSRTVCPGANMGTVRDFFRGTSPRGNFSPRSNFIIIFLHEVIFSNRNFSPRSKPMK